MTDHASLEENGLYRHGGITANPRPVGREGSRVVRISCREGGHPVRDTVPLEFEEDGKVAFIDIAQLYVLDSGRFAKTSFLMRISRAPGPIDRVQSFSSSCVIRYPRYCHHGNDFRATPLALRLVPSVTRPFPLPGLVPRRTERCEYQFHPPGAPDARRY